MITRRTSKSEAIALICGVAAFGIHGTASASLEAYDVEFVTNDLYSVNCSTAQCQAIALNDAGKVAFVRFQRNPVWTVSSYEGSWSVILREPDGTESVAAQWIVDANGTGARAEPAPGSGCTSG